MDEVSVRTRRDGDLPALLEIISAQQAETGYPLRWPWPGDLADFVRRPEEVAAWVAEVDGAVAGHVALHRVADDELGALWSAAHGVPIDELRCVGVLFADRRRSRRGVGSVLLDRATRAGLRDGKALVLDVVAGHREPVELYLRRGWVVVGHARPDWLPASEDPVLVMVLPRSSEHGPSTTRG
ncbi:hypothetical protein GCM10011519_02620 [Marmoricola endophyticus]|uniref:N-acetyltransferase domain-containing protein n=1 Tax=Marmoricola endophyticus TaxID=2040280 RepID=A0A917BBJ5_9ACTN|nr:GNAT family N-acetyltransferase [Marmoricola endophyticus]GGF32685.1 hypothetical protein GCM10011519_02620 [Marmoricola endophyticus]